MRWLLAGIVCTLASAAAADGAFVPCAHNRPGDPGLRMLIEAVYRSDLQTQAAQRRLGWPATPLQGKPEDVDELAFCRCVHRKRAEALGEELAFAMMALDPRQTAPYDRWLEALPAQARLEHGVFRDAVHAACFNESRRPHAR